MKKHFVIGILIGALAIVGGLIFSLGKSVAPTKQDVKESQDTAKPMVFTSNTAMQAIFGSYNEKHKGTLIPVGNTAAWSIVNAEVLATPILAATFDEGLKRKGVLVVQRQSVVNGEIAEAHAETAEVSVYVFTYNGKEWVFEKGKKSVVTTGAHGHAPDGRLIRIGSNKYGLLFEGGDIHQGHTNDYLILVDISRPNVRVVFEADSGESNSGACSDDPKEWTESGGVMHECWGYEAKLDFLDDGKSDYYAIKVTNNGMMPSDGDGTIAPFKKVDYYAMTDSGFKLTAAPGYQRGALVPESRVYGVGSSQTREATMPTIPRRLLKLK